MISDAAFRILEEVGMDFLHPEALEILAQAGAEVQAERVHGAEAFLERDRAHARRCQHVGPRDEIGAVDRRRPQPAMDQPNAFGRDAVGERVRALLEAAGVELLAGDRQSI